MTPPAGQRTAFSLTVMKEDEVNGAVTDTARRCYNRQSDRLISISDFASAVSGFVTCV